MLVRRHRYIGPPGGLHGIRLTRPVACNFVELHCLGIIDLWT